MARSGVRQKQVGLSQKLDKALALHRENKLSEAALLYTAVLKAQPRNFDALHLLGVLRFEENRRDEAIGLINAALEVRPTNPEALQNLGLLLAKMGRSEAALPRYDRALAIEPKAAKVLHSRGNTLADLKRFPEALESFDKALAIEPHFPEALSNRGGVLRDLQRPEEAIECYDRALALRPDYPEALNNRGIALCDLKRLEEALASFDKALGLRPRYDKAHNNRGNTLLSLQRFGEALENFDQALAIEPNYPEALNNRAVALRELERPEEALASYDKALAVRPNYPEAFNNRGNALIDLMRFDEAIASYERAYALRPDYADARYNRGLAALTLGDFAAGWPDYEWRWEREAAPPRKLAANFTPWRGEDLRGKRIIVYEEQGLGDIIQFVRYLPLLSARGAQVTLLARTMLHRLLRPLSPAARITDRQPHGEAYDYQCALMSVPGAFGTTLDTVPADIPYLRAEAALVAEWQRRIGDAPGLKVGLVWAGNPQHRNNRARSIALARLLPVLEVPGTRWYSLQVGERAADLAQLPAGLVTDLSQHLGDFADTAAAIVNLDLVVAVDTAVAHLAGALGRPAWVMLPFSPDWRWLLEREDSPWYPTLRLFRQRRLGDWDDVFARVAAELSTVAGTAKAPPAAATGAVIDADLQAAIALHRENKLSEAARLYSAILEIQPDNFDARHLLGLARFEQDRRDEAIELIDAALDMRPTHPEALQNLGLLLARMGRSEEALPRYDRALAIDPKAAKVLYSRGNSLADLKRFPEALEYFDKALAVEPDFPEALNNRGGVLRDLRRLEEGVESYDRALALRPDYPEALNNRGIALGDLKRFEEALASYDRALTLRPGYDKALNNRGNALLNLRRMGEALENFDQALAIEPNYPEALNNRAIALRDLERPEEALASYDKALAARPNYPEALNNRGNALKDLMRFDEAIASYERAYALRPNYADARYNRGLAALMLGDFAAGWPDYERRWEREAAPARKLAANYRYWRGEELRGKRIIVYEEQGLGDVVQFVRYLPLLSARGAEVTLFVRPALHRLLRSLSPAVRITDRQPQGESCDYQCALMSLPAVFGTTLDTVPADVPYLVAEEALTRRWRERLGDGGFKIGICWQGNPGGKIDIGRSLPLRCFKPIAAIPGVRLISLQKTHGLEQLATLPEGMSVETLDDDFDSGPDAFVDTAAVIANLDLVVTSDTAVGHLAGAIGRPVWVALKQVPDWRWLLDREDSPWYPTMRLFRQRRRGDWDDVFARIAAELSTVAGTTKARPATKISVEIDADLQTAIALHRANNLDEAVKHYTAILASQPRHFDALHLLGVIRTQQGRPAEGREMIAAALKLQPQNAEAWSNLGQALAGMGRPGEALEKYDKALEIRPDFAEVLHNRGNALCTLNRPQEAVVSYERALAIRPDYTESLFNRGVALRTLNRPEEALASFDKALALQPDHVEVLIGRGNALGDLNRWAEALGSYDKVLTLRPEHAKALGNRGIALYGLNRREEALASYDRALALEPDYPDALNNRGLVLRDLLRPAEALASYNRALALRPDFLEALSGQGNALHDLGRFEEALASYDKTLALRPQYAPAVFNRAIVTLLTGDFAGGLPGYEARLELTPAPARNLVGPCPPWRGEDLRDRRIIVYEEQGLGDTIHFARYLPQLSAMGARVTLMVRASLHRLLRPLMSGIRLIDLKPPGEAFDYQCALLSLPALLGTTLDRVPAEVPYLSAEGALAASWRERLGGDGFKIGVCWQGNPSSRADIGRSVPLRCFCALAAVPGVRLISLQAVNGLDQLADLPPRMTVETLGDDFAGGPDLFVQAAAVIANLDLVITSDTAIAHLAGALGAPVWVILKQVADWRWLIDREDSPWYPTMRLFRQRQPGDWDEVLARVAAKVADPIKPVAVTVDAALALHRAGKLDEAAEGYTRVLAANPADFDALHLLGNVHNQQGRYEEALASYDKALRVRPDHADTHNNRGIALRALDRAEEALASYDEALRLRPDHADAHNNRGVALYMLNRLEEALASYDRALATRPEHADALNNRGSVLRDLQRPAEALASYDRALAIRPDYADAYNHRGNALCDLKRIDEALASYDRALAIRPDYPEAHYNRGFAALLTGDLRAGWEGYEYRWQSATALPRDLAAAHPPWRGEDLRGKRIIVYQEQGHGDVIQFARYLPLLAARGANVAFLIARSLHRLLRSLTPSVRLLDRPPHDETFDYQCALVSLPGAFGTTLDSVPADIPYLVAEAALVKSWRRRLGGDGFKIGICWQGNPTVKVDIGRSVPLRSFQPIAAIPGVRLISLQAVNGLDQLADLPAGMTVEGPGEELGRGPDAFVDAAAVIANLDLVITSDTAIAHLAGALGAPVWVVLKHVADWRWLLDREDSPWYPTMRLFRQAEPGDWDEVFTRVAAEVPTAAGTRKALPSAKTSAEIDADLQAGLALHRAGTFDAAAEHYTRVLASNPSHFDALHLLANVRNQQGRYQEALPSYDKALRLEPGNALAHYNHGLALAGLKRAEQALAAFDKCLAIDPDHPEALNNRGALLREFHRPAEAVASYDKALELRPDYTEALHNRGNALGDLGRYEEALASYDAALALRPDIADTLLSRGNALKDLARFDEAIASYDEALALRPDYPDARFDRALVILRLGDFAAGWPGYEARWERSGAAPRELTAPYPVWRGEELSGKRIIVYHEQGMGDVIQLARYLPRLAELGADVTLLVPASLHRLLRGLAPAPRITDRHSRPDDFDFQCALASLPGAFGTRLDTVPADVPYLFAEAARIASWRERLGAPGFKIGICWQGNPSGTIDAGRSLPLRCFEPIAAIPGVRLISLQKTHGLDQLASLPEGMSVETLGEDFDSGPDAFVDTAAVIANLDLVITCDTAIGHVAGALGAPIWLALRHVADWRWLLDREDSPWYPTMRLFRQRRRDDWDEVFARVAAEVARRVDPVAAMLDAALALHRAGKLDEAAAHYARILDTNPEHFDALHLLGVVRTQQGRHREGLERISAALRLQPASAEAHSHLGVALERLGRPEEALANHDKALAFRPEFAEGWNNRGNALRDLQRPAEALASYDRALTIKPDYPEALTNRGSALQDLLRSGEARGSYEKALALRPDYAVAHFCRGVSLLLAGDYAEGWREYGWRWRGGSREKLRPREFAQPLWDGGDVAGKTVLLHAEQGLGDTIQFIRLAPLLAARGARVIVEVQRQLLALLGGLRGNLTLIAAGDELPDFDLHLPLLDAPGALGITLESVPAEVPYLSAEGSLVVAWRRRIASAPGLKAGLVWAGNPQHHNDRNRSIAIERLLPVLEVPGVSWFSLQVGERATDVARLPAGMVRDLCEHLGDFAETAAAIANLDLVLTVDTAVAHVAGALGRPVWTMLPFLPDWRWLLEREDSPWYPTARLFRQRAPGDWDDVVARVARELAAVVGGQRERLRALPPHRTIDPKQTRHGRMLFPAGDGDIGRSLAAYGEFAELESEVWVQLIRPRDTVVEVGAKIGAHTLHLARLVGPSGTLLAFEPDPASYQLLCANLALNELFHVEAQVEMTNVDDLALPSLKLLKIDAAGAEADVLARACKTIERLRPVLYVSDEREARSEALIGLIDELGYDMWWHLPPLFNPGNFAGNPANIFGNARQINLLCLPKEANNKISGLRRVSGAKDRP